MGLLPVGFDPIVDLLLYVARWVCATGWSAERFSRDKFSLKPSESYNLGRPGRADTNIKLNLAGTPGVMGTTTQIAFNVLSKSRARSHHSGPKARNSRAQGIHDVSGPGCKQA